MARLEEPPPLFDDDEIKKEDEHDLFASAVQEISLTNDVEDDNPLFHSRSHPNLDLDQEVPEPSSVLPTVGAPITPVSTDRTFIETPPMPAFPESSEFTFPSGGIHSQSSQMVEMNDKDEFLQILVSEPQRVGEGMGLHDKLVDKYLHSGRIIPPAPEKSAVGATKIKLSGESTDAGSVEFIERRRCALERYINRTASHPVFRADPDFREFIELDAELPRATQTSAISGKGVLRLFNKVGETVNKITYKMYESDQWFEDKIQFIESLDSQLRKLLLAMEGLVSYRRELAASTAAFAKSAAVLSSVEEHSSLSRALHQLSEAHEQIHVIQCSQADADFYLLSEVTKDYINLIGAVKDVFHERVKTYQTWQHSLQTLGRKREAKAKAEIAQRSDRIQQSQEEITEWEAKAERGQEEFDKMSSAVKNEMEQFDIVRIKDFKHMLIKYLESLVSAQQQIATVWERFLPEAKAIA